MRKETISFLVVIAFIVTIFLYGILGMGWFGIYYKKTVGKANMNVDRELYEQSNSFTKGKRMEAIKLYKEYNECKTDEERKAIETIVQMDFADFDEDKYITNPKLLKWLKKAKY